MTVGVAVLALALAGFVQTSTGKQVTRALGLFVPSESFTELYFSNPNAVAAATENAPRHARRTETVRFTIHNTGHRALSYSWGVRVDRALRAVGTATLRPGRAANVRRDVHTGCSPRRVQIGSRGVHAPSRRVHASPPRVRITVVLRRPAESIGYWVRCGG